MTPAPVPTIPPPKVDDLSSWISETVPTPQPLPLASVCLESYNIETYLTQAHIPYDDKETRALMLVKGIVHWSFFQSTSEKALTNHGFCNGIARLLWEGPARLER